MLLETLRTFLPGPPLAGGREQVRASLGALIGIFITGNVTAIILGPSSALPLLIAPMGASALLVFAVPSSPLAQPWPVIGGNIISAAVGVTCVLCIEPPLIAAPVAVAGAILLMFLLRCLHPPGGAAALTTVLSAPLVHEVGYHFVWMPVAFNSILLVAVALLYNNATRRRYPHAGQIPQQPANPHRTNDPPTINRNGFMPADLDAVLKRHAEVIDIGRDDLNALFREAEAQGYRRRFGEIRCADIMSRDVITAQFDTTTQEAWGLMCKHNIKALPVLDDARQVIGIVTHGDFIRYANAATGQHFSDRLRELFHLDAAAQPETSPRVGHIMRSLVQTAREDMHVVELVPLLADTGIHHLPVVGLGGGLSGIVTQSDLVAALYRGWATDASA